MEPQQSVPEARSGDQLDDRLVLALCRHCRGCSRNNVRHDRRSHHATLAETKIISSQISNQKEKQQAEKFVSRKMKDEGRIYFMLFGVFALRRTNGWTNKLRFGIIELLS